MMKLSDVELVQREFNPPVVLVIKALYAGLEVKLGGHTLLLAKTRGDGEMIIAKMSSPEYAFAGFDITFEHLTTLANKLSVEELAMIAGNLSLLHASNLSRRGYAGGSD